MVRTSILLVFGLLLSMGLSAQKAQVGIGLSVGHSDLTSTESQLVSPINSVVSEGGWGFGLNIYASLPIVGRLYLSTNPTIEFQDQRAVFHRDSMLGSTREDIQSVGISLPLRAELRSQKGSWRPVVAAGGGILLNIAETEDSSLKSEDLTAFWEVSAGLDKTFKRFVFRPEIFARRSLNRAVPGDVDNPFNRSLGNTDWSYIGLRLLFYGKPRTQS